MTYESNPECVADQLVENVNGEVERVHDGVGDPFFRVILEEAREWGWNVAGITVEPEGVVVTFLFTGRPVI